MNSKIYNIIHPWCRHGAYPDDIDRAQNSILKTLLEKIKKVRNIHGIKGIISRRDVNKAIKDLFKEKQ